VMRGGKIAGEPRKGRKPAISLKIPRGETRTARAHTGLR
jgi:hypothetical protein